MYFFFYAQKRKDNLRKFASAPLSLAHYYADDLYEQFTQNKIASALRVNF